MMKKCLVDKQDMYLGLLAMQNTPTEGMDSSPSQRQMGRHTRTTLPIIDRALNHQSMKNYKPDIDKRKARAASYHTEKRSLPVLEPGQKTAIQPIAPNNHTWTQGTVQKQIDARSYEVKTDAGAILRRNRKMLRAKPKKQDQEENLITASQQDLSVPIPETPN